MPESAATSTLVWGDTSVALSAGVIVTDAGVGSGVGVAEAPMVSPFADDAVTPLHPERARAEPRARVIAPEITTAVRQRPTHVRTP